MAAAPVQTRGVERVGADRRRLGGVDLALKGLRGERAGLAPVEPAEGRSTAA